MRSSVTQQSHRRLNCCILLYGSRLHALRGKQRSWFLVRLETIGFSRNTARECSEHGTVCASERYAKVTFCAWGQSLVLLVRLRLTDDLVSTGCSYEHYPTKRTLALPLLPYTGNYRRLAGGDHQADRARRDREDLSHEYSFFQGPPRECDLPDLTLTVLLLKIECCIKPGF